MEMTGEHNKRLKQYDDFVTGPDTIQKLEFVDDEHYYATSSNEVSPQFFARKTQFHAFMIDPCSAIRFPS
jgi:hypothetical protein